MHVFPDLGRGYLVARRAMQGWQKVAIQGEGSPVPWDGVFAIAAVLQSLGYTEEADIVEISADTYMRDPDWSLIQPEDIISTPD